MAKKDEDGTVAAPATVDMNAFAGVLAQAIAQAQSIYQPREIKEGDPEFVARQQAEGFFDRFERPVYQNGKESEPRGETAETRHRASNLKSGTYFLTGRKVIVEANDKGVWLHYPTKGDAMMINQNHWRSFADLINQIWDQMHAPVPA